MIPLDEIPVGVIDDIKAHAAQESPRECCGVIVVKNGRMVYIGCTNLAADKNEEFEMDLTDFYKAEDHGAPVIAVHSHPFHPPTPSEADLVRCEESGLQWLIINHPVGTMQTLSPSGYQAPLEGRSYSFGTLDCYSLVRDYYDRVLGVTVKNFPRIPDWWEKGMDMFVDHYSEAGFVKIPVEDMKVHDVMLFQHNSLVPNHAGVWLGDNRFIHHLSGRCSSRDVYSGYWRKIHTHCFRHGSLM